MGERTAVGRDTDRHVGQEEWLRIAGELLCFRPQGGDPGSKATADDYMACIKSPDHPGDCTFGNAGMAETIVDNLAAVRP